VEEDQRISEAAYFGEQEVQMGDKERLAHHDGATSVAVSKNVGKAGPQ
jgi:hypothetical protein